MVNIYKKMVSEPNTLKRFRLQKETKEALKSNKKGMFDRYVDEFSADELREILKHEQGAICCYCMCSIATGKTKIEHFQSRDEHPDREVDYSNLYLACDGEKINCNENQDNREDVHEICKCKHQKESENKKIVKHCDTCKENRELKYIDLSDIENKIKYESGGTIYSDDPNIDKELNYILNLNLEILKTNRLQAKLDLWSNLSKKGTWNVQDLIKKYQNQPVKAPYLGFILYMLAKKLPKK
jgi:uncharacterized protein (TIGR02646 family)